MPAHAIQERLRRIVATDEFNEVAKNNLHLITPDLQDGPMPDLSTKSGRDSIEEFVEPCDLIIIDNISSLFRSGIENEAESWQPAQDWALELRRRGKSILFIHHAGKGGQQRGSSKKEDILDTVLCLKHPPNYQANQGALFEVVYEKTRHFAGDEAMPFQVKLRKTEDGLFIWDVDAVEIDPEVLAVAELSKNGHTIAEIMKKTGLTKGKVEGRLKRAKDLELID
jgi:putative DNA primase/helicase